MTAPGVSTGRISLTEFLAALSAAAPHLPGASCRSHVELFDRTTGDTRKPDTREARTAALNLCHTCPALDPCRTWLDSLPAHQRPTGVIASRIVTADTTQSSSFQREKAARDKRITELHATGLATSEIAAMTGCSKTTVLRAISGRR